MRRPRSTAPIVGEKILYVTIPGIVPTIATLFILNMGMFLSAGLDQVFNLQNDVNRATIDIIDTYVYRIGLQTGEYALATAAGLFKGVIGFILIILAHLVSKRLTGRGGVVRGLAHLPWAFAAPVRAAPLPNPPPQGGGGSPTALLIVPDALHPSPLRGGAGGWGPSAPAGRCA